MKIIKIICFGALLILLASGYLFANKYGKADTSMPQDSETIVSTPITSLPTAAQPTTSNTTAIIPAQFYIANVPFQSQAPQANWDHLHDEACEEASLAIVDFYLTNRALSSQEMEKQIQAMVAFEEKKFGAGDLDLKISQEKTLAENFYGLSPTLKAISSLDDIKAEISQNHLVIVPAAGRLLDNPNFKNPGPIYHMLVVRGYTKSAIITNDVGTRNGLNFKYSNNNFWDSLHDWTGNANTITSGAKVMLVF